MWRSPRPRDVRRSAPPSASTRTSAEAGSSKPKGRGPTDLGAELDISYPLFNGGSVRNNVRAAETRVEAGRATLTAVEGDVFTQAVTAYMDVIRDRAIVELNQNNVKVLDDQPRGDARPLPDRRPHPNRRRPVRSAASARPFAACEIAGQLAASEATYRQVIGHAPGTSRRRRRFRRCPPPDEAVRIALANNPDLFSISATGHRRRL